MSFKSTKSTSYNASWDVTPEQGPDKDLENGELQSLREKSQQLIRDNLVVSGMQQTYLNQILSYGPTIYSASENKIQREQINNYLESKLASCDITGSKSFEKVLEEIVSTAFGDGDLVINLPSIDGETVVELVEAQRVDTPFEFRMNEDKYLYRHGVKYAESGVLLGFYIKKAKYIDYSYKSKEEFYDFFPMYREADGYRRKVTVLFKAPLNSRPLASRQYPIVTPMVPFLKNLDDYNEAVIVGARVAACFSAFITSKNPNAAQKAMSTNPEGGRFTDNDGRPYTKLQPGSIMYLRMNEEVDIASPNKPGDNHDSFVLRSYKTLCMAFRVPYILAFLDTEAVSYSSWRGAVLDSFKMVNRWRRELNSIIKWIVSTFVLEGIASGKIRGSLSTAAIRIRWPAPGVLDNEKEARGDKLDLENKTKSHQMICDERGIDYEEVMKEREEEELREIDLEAKKLKKKKDYEASLGIVFPDTVQPKETDVDGQADGKVDPDEAKERRKEDGNW